MSDQLVNNIRRENYPLQIYNAFENNSVVIEMTTKLISFVQEVYRYIEPGHFKGKIVIFSTLDDSILPTDGGIKFFDKNILINNRADVLAFQLFNSENLPLFWQNISTDVIFNATNAIVYKYENFSEYFFANKLRIEIINRFDCASIYALQYHYLSEALLRYKEEKIRFSSCSIFQTAWFDTDRIYFNQQPEEIMQKSLREFLDSSLRGVDVVREYNLGASKPVDVRVYWKEANRAALIELKWLGQSKTAIGLSTAYANGRGNDGLDQIKEYMDLENQDTPTCITKGYLVVIDGRRRGVARNPLTINVSDGMYYMNKEIIYATNKNFYGIMTGFENPIRMFTEPICS